MRSLGILAALAALPVAAACGSSSKSPGALGDQGDDASSHAEAGSSSGGSGGGFDASASSSGGEAGMHDASEGSAGEGGAAAPWVLGYFSSWDSQTNGGFYPVSAIDWDGLTHIATAFYIPDGTGGWASGSFDDATATAIITAAHQHGKKAIASIGGANSGPGFEGSTAAAHDQAFLAALKALVTMGYDGIDIDWEGGNFAIGIDEALQKALLQDIRGQSPGSVLTMTAGYLNENSVGDLSWYGTVAPLVDQVNLMTYGMSGAYQGWQSWHSSPLHWNSVTSTPTGIDKSVSHYLAVGVPASKLGVGSGFYGECYTSPVTTPVQALGSSTVAASDGTMSYRNILASYYSASAYHYDSAADVPFLTLAGSNAQGCTYVSYEDATSIAAKAAWVKAQGLGGTIIWTISEGYVASGANVQAQNPLLEAMKTGFGL
jgi:chitinase